MHLAAMSLLSFYCPVTFLRGVGCIWSEIKVKDVGGFIIPWREFLPLLTIKHIIKVNGSLSD